MDNSVIIDAVRAALAKGGQHILIAPDGGVSIWPDDCADIIKCKDCKKWKELPYPDGCKYMTCVRIDRITKPDDYCSYAEAMDNADGETPLPC